jgi:hypothetical protein
MPSRKDGGKRGAGVRSSREPRDRGDELRRFEPVFDELVLAAVERAERHREREGEGVMMSEIAEHLGFVHGSWTTRRLRPQIDAFIAAGLLSRSRRHGVVVWGLTSAGRGRVARGDAWVGCRSLRSIVCGGTPGRWLPRGSMGSEGKCVACWRRPLTSLAPMGCVRSRGSRWLSVCSRRAGSSGRRCTACRSGPSPTTPAPTLTTARNRAMSRSTSMSWAGCVIGVVGVATCGSGPTPDLQA